MRLKKTVLLLFLCPLISFSQTKDFEIFINNFTEQSLPYDSRTFFSFDRKTIDDKLVEKYICDNLSDCFYIHSRYKIQYYYLAKFDVSSKFYLVLYEKTLIDSRFGQREYILCSYSKKTQLVLSKISLRVWHQNGFYLYAIFERNLEIELFKIYTEGENSQIKPNPLQPQYFWIDEFSSKYKILKNGYFIQTSETKENKYIGRLGKSEQEGIYVYPVTLNDD